MILVILTAFLAVCGAAKLNQGYLPPITAKTAGGRPGALQAPFDGSNQALNGLPTGSYTNDAQGVVVDAVNPGTRTLGDEPTGLGGPRASYGSTDSKVGNAAFIGTFESEGSRGPLTRIAPGFDSFISSSQDANANKIQGNNLKFATDVGTDSYNYEFKTDNGISVGENGFSANGVQAQGGYSYKGDDGKTYKVTYTADKDGYKPQGHHLPTPPPIPDEILKSLEKNAKEEAAGLVDDGSYDAQKYNDEGDYSSNGAGNNKGRPITGSSLASQSNQAQRPTSGVLIGSYNPGSVLSHTSQVHGAQGQGFVSGDKQSGFGYGSTVGGETGHFGSSISQFENNDDTSFQYGAKPQLGFRGTQAAPQGIVTESGPQIGSPTLHSSSDTSNLNTAYSSAKVSGSGTASAFASTGSAGTELNNQQYLVKQQGIDKSYYYNQPAKTFNTPTNSKVSSNYQTSSYNGVTQAAISPFPSSSSDVSTQNVVENNQLGSKPTLSQSSNTQQSNTQFEVTGSKQPFVQKPAPQFGTKPVLQSQTHSSQTPFSQDSTQSLTQQYQGTVYEYNKPAVALSTAEAKPSQASQFGVQSIASSTAQGSSSQSTSGLAPQTQSGQASLSGLKLFIPQQSSSTFQNTQIGSTGSQFGQKPSEISSFTANTASKGQAVQTSQFGQKPSESSHTGSSIQENHFSQKPFGSFQIGSSFQQNQFGSSTVSQLSQGLGSTSGVASQGQIGQASLSGTKPSAPQQSSSTFQNTYIGSTGSQFGYKPSGSSSFTANTASKGQAVQSSQFGLKPFGSSQTGSSFQQNQIGQKPFGSSQTESSLQQHQFGSTLSSQGQLVQKPSVGSSSTVNTASKGQSGQTSQFGQKPFGSSQTGTSFQQNQIGSVTVSQSSQGLGSTSGGDQTVQTSQFGNKPFSSSQIGFNLQQNQVGQKPYGYSQTGSSIQQNHFGQKPFGSFQTGSSFQQNQFGSSTVSQSSQGLGSTSGVAPQGQIGQASLSGTKPSAPQQSSSTFQNTYIGSTGSQFGYKPSESSSFTANTASKGQAVHSSQFGLKPFGSSQTGSSFQQNQIGQKPFGSSQTESSLQHQFGSSLSSQVQLVQKPSVGSSSTVNTATKGQSGQTSQFGQKPFGSSQTGTSFQQNQIGSATVSQSSQGLGSTSGVGQTVQASQFGNKPFSSSQIGSNLQQNQVSQKPYGYSQTGSSIQQNQFSSSTVSQLSQGLSATSGVTSQGQIGQASVSGTKPSAPQQSSSTFQNTHIGSTGSQFGYKPSESTALSANTASKGQAVQTSQFGQKPLESSQTGSSFQQNHFGQNPFGSFQTGSSFQQNQFGSSTVSQSSQGLGSTSGVTSQGQIGQASLSGTKPSAPQQSSSTFQNTYIGSTGSQFGYKPSESTAFTANTASKGQAVQSSQFGLKPFGSSQTGSSFQQNQIGQKPFGSSQTGPSLQQHQFGSPPSSQGQLVQKPSEGSLFTVNTASKGQSGQTSQFSQKPFGSFQTGSSFQQNQFGSSTVSQLSQGLGSTSGVASQGQIGQASLSGTKPTAPQQSSSTFQNTYIGSTGSQFGYKPSESTAFTANTASKGQTVQTSQFGQKPLQFSQTGSSFQQNHFGQKPFGSFQTGSSFQQNEFGSSTVSQSSQGLGSTSGIASQGQIGQASGTKPSAPQQSSSTFQNTYIGSTGSQFGYKPSESSSFTANTASKGQAVQSSQFGLKPFGSSQTGSSFQQNQIGQKPFGSSQTESSLQHQFGSSLSSQGQLVQKPSVGSSYTVNTATKGQSGQTSQFGQKPFGSSQTGTSFQQNQIGSATVSQSSQGLGSTSGVGQTVQTSQFANKPFSSSQIGSNLQQNQVGQKPYGHSQTGSSIQQNHFGQKPFGSFQSGSSFQQNQFGSSTVSQLSQGLGSTSGEASQGQIGQASLSGTKPSAPQHSSPTFQNTYIGSTGSQFGYKPSESSSFTANTASKGQAVQSSQFGLKPFGSSQTGSSFQQNQIGQKPFGSSQTESSFQQHQFGSTLSSQGQLVQKPSEGSSFTVNTATKGQSGQTSQFGQKPFGSSQTGTSFQQNQIGSATVSQSSQGLGSTSGVGQTVQTSQFANKPFSSSQIGSNLQQNQVGQKPYGHSQTGSSIQQNHFGQKPFGSFQTGSSFQQNQFGSSTVSQSPQGQLVQKPSESSSFTANTASKGQAVQTSQFGQKPFGSSQTGSSFQQSQVGQKPYGSSQTGSSFTVNTASKVQSLPTSSANAFASSASSNEGQYGSQTQKPYGAIQANQVHNYKQTSQFGVQQQGGTSLDSTLTQNQQSQFGFGFGQTLQQAQSVQGQKPFGNGQSTTFQAGSQGDQNTQPTQSSTQTSIVSSPSIQSSFGSSGSSVGYIYKKPQTTFNTVSQLGVQSNGIKDQKTQQTQTIFNPHVTTSQQQLSVQPIKPIVSPLSQGSFEQSQSTVDSSQFGVHSDKKTNYNTLTQTSRPQFSASTTSSSQTENSAVSTTQFGTQPALATGVSHFGVKPIKVVSAQSPSYNTHTFSGSLSSAQPSQSAIVTTQSPSQLYFSGGQSQAGYSSTLTPSFPNKLGSNVSVQPEEHIASTVLPIVPTSGYELDNSSQGSFDGQGEKFGGARDPPRFDDKTGYHY